MSVIYKCIHCGKDIESDCIYNGPARDFPKFIADKTKKLSELCDCNNKATKGAK